PPGRPGRPGRRVAGPSVIREGRARRRAPGAERGGGAPPRAGGGEGNDSRRGGEGVKSMNPGVLMVGSFVAPHVLERYVSGALGERLAAKGWQVTFTSRMRARLPRVLDMLRTTFRSRSRYDVAQVEVYSGSAFIWA